MNKLEISIYGNGENIREWLFVKDHAEALIEFLTNCKVEENIVLEVARKRNNEIVSIICNYLDNTFPSNNSYKILISL